MRKTVIDDPTRRFHARSIIALDGDKSRRQTIPCRLQALKKMPPAKQHRSDGKIIRYRIDRLAFP